MLGGKYHKSLKKRNYTKGKKVTKKTRVNKRDKRGNTNKITKKGRKGRTMKKRGGGVASELVRSALPVGLYALQRLLNKPKSKRQVHKLETSIKRKFKSMLR